MNIENIESILEECILCNDNLHNLIIDETLEKLEKADNVETITVNLIKAIKELGSEKRMLLVSYSEDKTEFIIINKKMESYMMIMIIKTKDDNYNFFIESNIKREIIFTEETK